MHFPLEVLVAMFKIFSLVFTPFSVLAHLIFSAYSLYRFYTNKVNDVSCETVLHNKVEGNVTLGVDECGVLYLELKQYCCCNSFVKTLLL